MTFEELPFIINEKLRLSSPYLQVLWHEIPQQILEYEMQFPCMGRNCYKRSIICDSGPNKLVIWYTPSTDFENLAVQRWLRTQIRQHVIKVAEVELPDRLHWHERNKNLYCKSVKVAKLRKNVLGSCSHTGNITLSPKLVLFPQRMSDVVMLHEMAHLKYRHHKKSFWAFLSQLIGEDSNSEKMRSNLAYFQKSAMIDWLMK